LETRLAYSIVFVYCFFFKIKLFWMCLIFKVIFLFIYNFFYFYLLYRWTLF
jgi:hypothetical protein